MYDAVRKSDFCGRFLRRSRPALKADSFAAIVQAGV